jgi:hypothetical protein
MPLEPLICRWRYGNVKKSYKNQRKFGESKYIRIFAMLKKTRVLTVSDETTKTKKLWQQQIGQLSKETKRPIKLYYLIWKQNGRTKQR